MLSDYQKLFIQLNEEINDIQDIAAKCVVQYERFEIDKVKFLNQLKMYIVPRHTHLIKKIKSLKPTLEMRTIHSEKIFAYEKFNKALVNLKEGVTNNNMKKLLKSQKEFFRIYDEV